jgi:hypothetical protein
MDRKICKILVIESDKRREMGFTLTTGDVFCEIVVFMDRRREVPVAYSFGCVADAVAYAVVADAAVAFVVAAAALVAFVVAAAALVAAVALGRETET